LLYLNRYKIISTNKKPARLQCFLLLLTNKKVVALILLLLSYKYYSTCILCKFASMYSNEIY